MNLWKNLKDRFLPAAPPTLRNKPGGLAWVKSYAPHAGCDEFAGSIVTTVSVRDGSFWSIEPPVAYTAKCAHRITRDGVDVPRGARVVITALSDDLLVPIGSPGDEARDQSAAWLPPVPHVTRERERA